MENDVLKNKIAPWQEKGRWYHGLYDTATKNFITPYSDEIFHTMAFDEASTHVYLKTDYIIKDCVVFPDGPLTVQASTTLELGRHRVLTGGEWEVSISNNQIKAGLIHVYIFI